MSSTTSRSRSRCRDRRPDGERRGSTVRRSRGHRVRASVALTIAGMALATYLTRALLLLALARRPLPARLRLWLRLILLAVLPALAVPMVLAPGGQLVVSAGEARGGGRRRGVRAG